MKVLVAYASRRGSTAGIAERIAETLGRHGLDVTFREIDHVGAPEGFDAFVIGSSAYMGHWEKGAGEFVRDHATTIAARPTWLFSAGPIGTDMVDKQGRDVLEASRPQEFAEFESLVRPREKKIFFGAYDPEGMKESLGSMVGLDSHRVKGDLEKFKEFIESRSHETGAWRGDVEQN